MTLANGQPLLVLRANIPQAACSLATPSPPQESLDPARWLCLSYDMTF